MDISIVLVGHKEGLLFYRTINVLERLRQEASEINITTEVIVVLDNASAETQYCIELRNLDYTIVKISAGEPSTPRNTGIEKSKGKYVLITDGDDLISFNFLTSAFQMAESLTGLFVLHSEYTIIFGEESGIWKHYNYGTSFLNPQSFIDHNPYHVLCFAPKEVFQSFPYKITRPTEGYGYEDFDFVLSSIAHGVKHLIVPRTTSFIRIKVSNSVMKMHQNIKALVPQNRFYSPKEFLKLCNEYFGVVKRDVPVNEKHSSPFFSTLKLRRVFSRLKSLKVNRQYFLSYRIDTFLKIQLEAFKILLPNKGVKYAETIKQVDSDDFITKGKVPEWLKIQMKEINFLEPEIRYSRSFINESYKYVLPTEAGSGQMLYDFYTMIQKKSFDKFHLFFLPWLKMGGSDKQSIRYINSLIENNENVVVVLTEVTDSEWLYRLKKEALVFDASFYLEKTPLDMWLKTFARIIQETEVLSLQIINSNKGYQLLSYYGLVLKEKCPLYIHLFCRDADEEGNLCGYAFDEFYKVYPYIHKVITDNKSFINFLHAIYGYDKERFKCIYQPINVDDKDVEVSTSEEPLKILWAGRFDAQKRPEVLLEVLEKIKTEGLKCEVDIYGKNVLNSKDFTGRFRKYNFVTVHNAFSKWEDLEYEKVDIFLYTSAYDGMPNVVLEALSKGLIVISADEGGINEIIENDVNGFLVPDDKKLVDGLVENIRIVNKSRYLKKNFFEKTKEKLRIQHGHDKFNEELRKEFVNTLE